MSGIRVDLEVFEHDSVRRRYIELGPCQPKNHDFKYRDIGGHPRRFCPVWFKENKWPYLWICYGVFALNFFLYLPYPVTDSWLRPSHGDIRYSSDHLLALAQRGTTVGRALFELPFQCFLLHLHGTVADFHAPPRQPAHDGICSISEAAKT